MAAQENSPRRGRKQPDIFSVPAAQDSSLTILDAIAGGLSEKYQSGP